MTTQNSNQNQTPATLASIQQFSFFNPEQFATMQRVAKMFSNSELVPDMYQTSKVGESKAISNSIIAIDIANRIEANILMVMQNLVIIYGRPSWSSKFLISTVNTCGRFEPLRFKFENIGEIKNYKYSEWETSWEQGKKKTKSVAKNIAGPIDNIKCIAYTYMKGMSHTPENVLESAPIDVKMAIDEGWYTKKGSKWPNMTQQMLMYRSASFWTNAYAPELSMGMRTAEEVHDTIDIDYEEVKDKIKENENLASKENSEEIDIDNTRENIPPKGEPIPEPEPAPQPEKKEEPGVPKELNFG